MQASEIAATFRPWKRGREGDRRSSIRLSKQEQTTAAFTPPASSFPSPLFAILINSLQVFSQRDIADYFTRGCWPVQNRSRSPRLLPRSSPGTDLSSLSSSVEGTREEDRVFEIIGGANNDLGLERIRSGGGIFNRSIRIVTRVTFSKDWRATSKETVGSVEGVHGESGGLMEQHAKLRPISGETAIMINWNGWVDVLQLVLRGGAF